MTCSTQNRLPLLLQRLIVQGGFVEVLRLGLRSYLRVDAEAGGALRVDTLRNGPGVILLDLCGPVVCSGRFDLAG